MIPTWDELAGSTRWRGVVSFIRNWVGPLDAGHGMAPAELEESLRARGVDLPTAVREWYRLAGRWDPGGLLVWMRPGEREVSDGMVWLLADPQGITCWGVRVQDLGTEDPPVYCREDPPGQADFPSFSQFVAAMVVNDVIFDDREGGPTALDPDAVRAELTCLVSAGCGNFYADGDLESATVVAFAYPRNVPVRGKSRTPTGEARLRRLRLESASG